MANYVYIATSLDGYIASKDNSIDWLESFPNPEGLDFGYTDFIAEMDALVMGRNTFEKVLTFGEWPYEQPVFVFTKTLTEVPPGLENKVKFVHGSIEHVLEQIHRLGFKRLYIDGGQLITSFLREDHIDEMTLSRVPLLLGDGLPLFGHNPAPLTFTHVETTAYANGIVKSKYKRLRE